MQRCRAQRNEKHSHVVGDSPFRIPPALKLRMNRFVALKVAEHP